MKLDVVDRRDDEAEPDYLIRMSILIQRISQSLHVGSSSPSAWNVGGQLGGLGGLLMRASAKVVAEEEKQAAIAERNRLRQEDEAARMAKAKEPKYTDHELMVARVQRVTPAVARQRLAEAEARTRAVGAKGSIAQQMARLKPE